MTATRHVEQRKIKIIYAFDSNRYGAAAAFLSAGTSKQPVSLLKQELKNLDYQLL